MNTANKKLINCTSFVLIILFCIASFTACSSSKQYFVYGTFLDIVAKGSGSSALTKEIYHFINGLEDILSPTVEGSDVYKINHSMANVKVECRKPTMDILRVASNIYKKSGGAYDPSVYPLVRLWGFSGDKFSIAGADKPPPNQKDIEDTLVLVGFDKAFTVDFENSTVTKNVGYDDAMLDFGGVAKGYAASMGARMAKSQKLLVNLGGNISAFNSDYIIGISNPDRYDRVKSNTSYYGTVALLSGESISTSGDYERYYQHKQNGVTNIYHHIIDPFTGKPSDSTSADGLVSVSIVSKDGGYGDALATAIMVLGKTEGQKLLNTLQVKAVLIGADLSYTIVGDLNFIKK